MGASASLTAALEITVGVSHPDHLDDIFRQISAQYGLGLLTEEEASSLFELIEQRRGRRSVGQQAAASVSALRNRHRFAPRRRQRSPNREASIRRRRGLARSSPMPAALAAHFTECESAVLAIVAGEVEHHGICDLPIDQIAAKVGCGRTSVQNALHDATRLGLVRVIRRPQRGAKSKTNIVEIISPE